MESVAMEDVIENGEVDAMEIEVDLENDVSKANVIDLNPEGRKNKTGHGKYSQNEEISGSTEEASGKENEMCNENQNIDGASSEWINVDKIDYKSSSDEYNFESCSDEEEYVSAKVSNQKSFDMNLLRQCLQHGAPVVETVSGKEAILILGKTGTGKSTLIQAVAGKAFYGKLHETAYRGGTIKKEVFEAKNPLDGFEIGHAKASMTSHLSSYIAKNGALYVDSPGFEDTTGHEVDIATSIMLSQVTKACNGVKFVILINYCSLIEDRGGAIRSVINLVRKFVQNFEQSKKSFMFVFTHINEIKGMATGSMDECRRKLLHEIVRIIDGTKQEDTDVKSVLRFMKQSLEKKYPFVHIFHPLETDVSRQLVRDMEKKLKAAKPQELTRDCVLTTSSHLKLDGEIEKYFIRLDHLLSKEVLDVDTVLDILDNLQYFKSYIGSDKVAKTVASAMETFNEYLDKLHALIEEDISKGLSPDHRFREENVTHLKSNIDKLKSLEKYRQMDMGKIKIEIESRVKCVHEKIDFKSCQDWKRLIAQMSNLEAWVKGFPDLVAVSNKILDDVAELIYDSMKTAKSFNTARLEEISSNEFDRLFQSLSVLQNVKLNHTAMGNYCQAFELKTVAEIVSSSLENLESALEGWARKTYNKDDILQIDYDQFEEVKRKAKVFTCIRELVLKYPSIDMYFDGRFQALDNEFFLNQSDGFTSMTESLKQLSQTTVFTDEFATKLSILKMASELYEQNCSSQGEDIIQYASLIRHIKSVLKRQSGELKEMSETASNFGIRDGKRDSQFLTNFQASIPFDKFLAPEEMFIQNCFIEARQTYNRRIDETTSQARALVNALLTTTTVTKTKQDVNNASQLDILKPLFEELHQITAFHCIREKDISNTEKEVRGKIREYVDQMIGKTENDISILEACFNFDGPKNNPNVGETEKVVEQNNKSKQNNKKRKTKGKGKGKGKKKKKNTNKRANGPDCINLGAKVNECNSDVVQRLDEQLEQVEKLFHLAPELEPQLSSIRSKIHIVCDTLSKKIEELMNAENKYEEKKSCLETVISIGNFTRYDQRLPSPDKLKDMLRDGIAKAAQHIHSMLKKTSEWDLIDGLIKEFERAKCLNQYLSSEVASHLDVFNKLRAEKQEEVTGLLEEMIRKQDYKGMQDFLRPFAQSEDQIKKKKFASHIEVIGMSLSETIREINQYLSVNSVESEENFRAIASCYSTLADAQKELGEYLDGENSYISINAEFTKLKKSLNTKLLQWTNEISNPRWNNDYLRLGKIFTYAKWYVNVLGPFLTAATKYKYEKAKEKYHRELEQVQSRVDEYADSGFNKVDNLLNCLSSLEKASSTHSPSLPDMSSLYEQTKKSLSEKIRKCLSDLQHIVGKRQCYADAIIPLERLNRHLKKGLQNHVDIDVDMIETDLDNWRNERNKANKSMDFEGDKFEEKILQWQKKLEENDPRVDTWINEVKRTLRPIWIANSFLTYKILCEKIVSIVEDRFLQSEHALKNRDFGLVNENLNILMLINARLSSHIEIANINAVKLQEKVLSEFESICDQVQTIMKSTCIDGIERIYGKYWKIVTFIPFTLTSEKYNRQFQLTNQLVYETFQLEIERLMKFRETFDFSSVKTQTLKLRRTGGFLTDNVAIFQEKLKHTPTEKEKWLDKLYDLCYEYFGCTRNLHLTEYYSLLDVLPSASKNQIKKSFNVLALKFHPDKVKGADAADANYNMQRLNEAKQKLLDAKSHGNEKSFDPIIKSIRELLRNSVRQFMSEQRYDQVEKVLFRLEELNVLDDLVTPPLNSLESKEAIIKLVRDCAQKVRTEVDSNWSEKRYKELNDNIVDLKLMEEKFKAYPDIFPQSWNDGIYQKIEDEIETLGQKARGYLSSRRRAKECLNEFRQCFIRMGAILVELPFFKKTTKVSMSNVLETCLGTDWGYGFLFEFGLALQRGDEAANEEESLIGQVIVSEFSHFKEVMTMVWNEETSQKPVTDTVNDIKGVRRSKGQVVDADLDRTALLQSFKIFDADYKSLLGEYIKPEADLSKLVQQIEKITSGLKPLSCDSGWGDEVKEQIPHILAGVFVVFTVTKSGASYNRIDAQSEKTSTLGEKLLFKPHNIQVLTLLCMFGCGEKASYLESQLMQIRTGEGKSMILGAAACVLGLLGFSVRCVCFSEYLSLRDYSLFEDVFRQFHLTELIKYSKITQLSEDTTAAKGDIRSLTEKMLRGELVKSKSLLCQPPNKHIPKTNPTKPRRSNRIKNDPQDTPNDIACVNENKPRRSKRLQGKPEGAATAVTSTKQKKLKTSSMLQNDAEDTSKDIACAKENKPRRSTRLKNEPEDSPKDIRETKPRRSTRLKIEPEDSPSGEISVGAGSGTVVKALNGVVGPTSRKETSNCQSVGTTTDEILLVDEVDVFFGENFYGQTYNQVCLFREPEVVQILKYVWAFHKRDPRRQRLKEVQNLQAYKALVKKVPNFIFMLDKEIGLMQNQVRHVNDDPKYYLNPVTERIGYKVMDTISYDATYGYRTVFAYLQEAEKGNLKNKDSVLDKVLAMPISCGQFSYANISPTRILGVSGTLDAMVDYEKDVLQSYGIRRYIYVPSVYGESNFTFDKAGEGIRIETSLSNYFHSITDQIKVSTKSKRAVIVFFRDSKRLNEFQKSSFYHKIGRKKQLLTESMSPTQKAFVISKAATAGQVTISTAVFGRGTDFFCKDERVQQNGGVHVIQTFLSAEHSEEIQVQGRTARQGKKGSYQMILLEKDLTEHFQIPPGEKDNIPRKEMYQWLCEKREDYQEGHWAEIAKNYQDATEKDANTHIYFDSLLEGDQTFSTGQFRSLYTAIKSQNMPSTLSIDLAFVVDVTGSMKPYASAIADMMKLALNKRSRSSILKKLQSKFPDTKFQVRVGVLGFRDIVDKDFQFQESTWVNGCHFTEDTTKAIHFLDKLVENASGGGDLAEDTLGAISRCAGWDNQGDWESQIKFMILLTDAPAHGFAPPTFSNVNNGDMFGVLHPEGLTPELIVAELLERDIDFFFCSFNPGATAKTEETLKEVYLKHPENTEKREVSVIPMAGDNQTKLEGGSSHSRSSGEKGRHIIFVLDESGSMSHHWAGVVAAYRAFNHRRLQNQNEFDLVSVVQFDHGARNTVNLSLISHVPNDLGYTGGGTSFGPAAVLASQIASGTPRTHLPLIVFMSDGAANDAHMAADTFRQLNTRNRKTFGVDLELHVIGFGGGADSEQLLQIARASESSKLYSNIASVELTDLFVSIAGVQDLAGVLEQGVGKRISEAIMDKVSLEYLSS